MTTPAPVKMLIVGTAPWCDIVVVNDEYASREHAAIGQYANGAVMVSDLGSTNGTRIRSAAGQTIKVYGPTPFNRGDVLIVGRTELPWRAE